MAPLAIADHLAADGRDVTVVYQTLAPSPLVGKYTIGAVMARLDEAGVTMVPMTRLVAIEPGTLTVAHCYSGRRWTIDGVDSVVLACGSDPRRRPLPRGACRSPRRPPARRRLRSPPHGLRHPPGLRTRPHVRLIPIRVFGPVRVSDLGKIEVQHSDAVEHSDGLSRAPGRTCRRDPGGPGRGGRACGWRSAIPRRFAGTCRRSRRRACGGRHRRAR